MSHQHDTNTDTAFTKNEEEASRVDKLLHDYRLLLPGKEEVEKQQHLDPPGTNTRS